jgi:cytochrome c biogenesis protein CcmG, thiol:disulfide interchange protein DsbE
MSMLFKAKNHLFILFYIFTISQAFSQELKGVPFVEIKTNDGSLVNISEIVKKDTCALICFWATWCAPCKKEFTAFSKVYEQWQKEFGLKIIAISIDESRSFNKANAFVKNQGWEFDFYFDPNQDLKKAMGVRGIPHLFLVNSKGQILWQHIAYSEGIEQKIYNEIKAILNPKIVIDKPVALEEEDNSFD